MRITTTEILALLGVFLLFPAFGMATASETVATLSYLGQSNLPRGMRNNNPGNIRKGSTPWQGKIPLAANTDGAFEQFAAYVYGIRAMVKNLQSYQRDRGLNTIQQIVSTWAPAADNNDTAAYVAAVYMATGIPPTSPIDTTDRATMRELVKAMTRVENGRDAVTNEQFNYAWTLL